MLSIEDLGFERALDVAFMDGQLTIQVLSQIFDQVVGFDQCSKAVAKMEAQRKKIRQLCLVDQASIVSYEFTRHFSGIFMNQCT